MTAQLITHPDCLQHLMPRHPERPERLTAVLERLQADGITSQMNQVLANEISLAQLSVAHPEHYIAQILNSAPAKDSKHIKVEPDTYMSSGSSRAARLAAGALVQAVETVVGGQSKRAFCAIRPPGHHAEISAAMGFCLFNNVAVAARTALLSEHIQRVAILDFDVHHCNGTVDIFKDQAEVLVCSSFQDHFYPNRYLDFDNDHIVSTRLEAGTKSSQFRKQIEADWLPALQAHKPDLILVSAGFDAHKDDPLGAVELVEDDYTWITSLIVDQANAHSQGRIISTLEGGYDLKSLSSSAASHVAALI